MSDRLAALNLAAREALPGLLGVEVLEADGPAVRARMEVHAGLMAPNGYLHAASVVALADTACGFGCWLGLPEDGPGFTTLELKANFMGTARDGVLTCDATRIHGGRTTEVWDAEVRDAQGHRIALFRCTQLILQKKI